MKSPLKVHMWSHSYHSIIFGLYMDLYSGIETAVTEIICTVIIVVSVVNLLVYQRPLYTSHIVDTQHLRAHTPTHTHIVSTHLPTYAYIFTCPAFYAEAGG